MPWVVVTNFGKCVVGVFNNQCRFKPTKYELSSITLSAFEMFSLLQDQLDHYPHLPHPNFYLSNYPHLMVQDGNGAAQGVLRQRGGILDSLHRHFQGERHPPPVPAAPQRQNRGEAAQVFPLEPDGGWW